MNDDITGPMSGGPSPLAETELYERLKGWFIEDRRAQSEWYREAEGDFAFHAGHGQWEEADRQRLKGQNRPCVTFKHMIFVPAAALIGAVTNGAVVGTIETTTNKHNLRTFDFDATTQEFACFTLTMPKSWNEGTVTFRPIWTFSSSSGGVVWALQAVAVSDDDPLDVAYGAEQTATDTALTAGDLHRGPESAAITVAGSPAASDTVLFRIKRNPADASDTLGADARLIGIEIYVTTDAGSDA